MWKYLNNYIIFCFGEKNLSIKRWDKISILEFINNQLNFACKLIKLAYISATLFLVCFSYFYYQSNIQKQIEDNIKQKNFLLKEQLDKFHTIINNTAMSVAKLTDKQEIYEFIKNSAFLLTKDKWTNITGIIQLLDCSDNYVITAFGEKKPRENLCKNIKASTFKENSFEFLDLQGKDIENKVYKGVLVQNNKYLYIIIPVSSFVKAASTSVDNFIATEIIPSVKINMMQTGNALTNFAFIPGFDNQLVIISYIKSADYYKHYFQELLSYLALLSLPVLLLLGCIAILRRKTSQTITLIEKVIQIDNAANKELGLLKEELINRKSQAILLAKDNISILKEICGNNSISITTPHARTILEKIDDILNCGIYLQAEIHEGIELASVINFVFQLLGKVIYEMNIQVTKQIPASLAINTDELFVKYIIANIVSNLLANASKKEGYIVINAQKHGGEKGNGTYITIEDNGFCIPTKPHIKNGVFLPLKEIENIVISVGWSLSVEHTTYEGNKITLFIPNKIEFTDIKGDKYDNVIRLF